jgi:hypothetical protein
MNIPTIRLLRIASHRLTGANRNPSGRLNAQKMNASLADGVADIRQLGSRSEIRLGHDQIVTTK